METIQSSKKHQTITRECQPSLIFHFICGLFGPVTPLIEFSVLSMKSFFLSLSIWKVEEKNKISGLKSLLQHMLTSVFVGICVYVSTFK